MFNTYFKIKIKFGGLNCVTTFAKKVMEIPPIYKKSEVMMLVGSYPEEVSLDLISSKVNAENATEDDAREAVNQISVALMALCKEEIVKNQVGKTAPFLNLCMYLVSEFPEIVMDDETYYLRKTLLNMREAIAENPTAILIRDAFMEEDIPEKDATFQFQLVAVSREESYIPKDKVQIYIQDDEE